MNRVVIDRRPLLLLVSSASLLAILTPARDVKHLPMRLADLVAQRLGRLGVPRSFIDLEVEAMTDIRLAPTSDRSVLGIMVDYAKMLPGYLEPDFSARSGLFDAEELLWENPCFAGKAAHQVIWPRRETLRLLKAAEDAAQDQH